MQTQEPIDVVITWVDGNDPIHKRKMQPYLKAEFPTDQTSEFPEDLAGKTRFGSVGEIYFCIASILRFATFVRKIFIVTDNQNPDIEDFISLHFPENKIPVVIVDHKELFLGLEKYLPVFNSLSIESCLYKIPDLSEHFVYFNDDVFLVRKTEPTDWFIDNKAVLYGKMRARLSSSPSAERETPRIS